MAPWSHSLESPWGRLGTRTLEDCLTRGAYGGDSVTALGDRRSLHRVKDACHQPRGPLVLLMGGGTTLGNSQAKATAAFLSSRLGFIRYVVFHLGCGLYALLLPP